MSAYAICRRVPSIAPPRCYTPSPSGGFFDVYHESSPSENVSFDVFSLPLFRTDELHPGHTDSDGVCGDAELALRRARARHDALHAHREPHALQHLPSSRCVSPAFVANVANGRLLRRVRRVRRVNIHPKSGVFPQAQTYCVMHAP